MPRKGATPAYAELVAQEAIPAVPDIRPLDKKTVLGADEDVDASTWSTREVARWLASLGLGRHAQAFADHRITGDLLHVSS